MPADAAIKQKVLALIDELEDERIRFLQDFVRIPSPEGEDEHIINYSAARLRDLGANQIDVFRADPSEIRAHPGYSPVHPEHSTTSGGEAPVVVATFKGAGGGRSLMFY